MIKKILSILLIIVLITGISQSVKATELKNTKLQVVKQSTETENSEENYAKLSKTIVASDETTGEVTLEVKVTNGNNTSEDNQNAQIYDNTEIFFLVPESEIEDGIYNESFYDELDSYFLYIEQFATKMFKQNPNVKIGLIKISGPDDSFVEGTEEDSEVLVELTNDVDSLKNARSELAYDIRLMNLQSALRLAKTSYSENTNKILISLFDNVPDLAIGIENGIYKYKNETWQDAKDKNVSNIVKQTKEELLGLKDYNIDFILLRPDDTSFNQQVYDADTNELVLDYDGSKQVQDLYGTIENPTYGKMYSLNNDSLEKIVTEYMYNDVIEKIGTSMNSVKITDYFPQEIIDNFDITISNPSTGEVSDSIDPETKSIIWNIETLNKDESATLQYKLKIKDMQNINLLNKIINTNEKIVVTYEDEAKSTHEIVLSTSPQIQLVEIAAPNDEPEANNEVDNTQSDKILPATGEHVIYISLIIAVMIIGTVTFKKIIDMKDIK